MPLPTRPLGRTGLAPTTLTLGTWGLAEGAYGPVPRDVFGATVEAAYEAGIRSFDVAPLWGDGLAEEVVGEVLAERRNECVLVSRVALERQGDRVMRPTDPRFLIASCDASRKRLRTERIDVLLLHEPFEKVLVHGSAAKCLAQLRDEKAIGAWGASVSSIERARIALSIGAEVLLVPYHLLASDLMSALEPDLDAAGATVLTRSPFAHGLLFGTWKHGHEFAKDDHRSERWDQDALSRRLRHVDALRFLVHDQVSSMGSAALRYVLSNPYVGSAIVGARSPAQIQEAVAFVAETDMLPSEDLERIPQMLSAVGG